MRPGQPPSVTRGASANLVDVGLPIGWATGALAFPEHVAQALHHFVVGGVQIATPGHEQFNRLADAGWLVDAALFADRQVHGEVQKGVGLPGLRVVHLLERSGAVGEVGVVFGVLFDPVRGQHFNRFLRLT